MQGNSCALGMARAQGIAAWTAASRIGWLESDSRKGFRLEIPVLWVVPV